MYFHPLLNEIIKQNGEILRLKKKIKKSDLKYYLDKYHLLKKNGYFNKEKLSKNVKYNLGVFKKSITNCRHLIFEVTENCNLNCSYCGYGNLYNNNKGRKSQTLSIEKAKVLIGFMVKKWNKKVNNNLNKEIRINFYGGEPLLNFNFIKEIVEYAKKTKLNYNEFTFGMTTNGTLLDKYMVYLKENDFSISISLDGNKRNNSYRIFKNGQSSFKRVDDNITLLNNRYPDYFKNKVDFLSVLHNKNSIEEIHGYFKKINKVSTFLPLSNLRIKKSQVNNFNEIFRDANKNISKSKANDITKITPSFILPISYKVRRFLYYSHNYFVKSIKDLLCTETKSFINKTGTCVPLSTVIFLNTKGEIFPCEKNFSTDPIGYVSDKDIDINFKKIKRTMNLYLDKLANQCNKCNFSNDCPTCILLIGIEENNFKCKNFKDGLKYREELMDVMDYIKENPGLYQKFANDKIDN